MSNETRRKNKQWTPEELIEVVSKAEEGMSKRRIAAQHKRTEGAIGSKLRAFELFREAGYVS